jgi:hypothetical protein
MIENEKIHLMIDIETLGTRPNSVILSVGAVLFDLCDKIEVMLHKKISIQSCLDAGLEVNGNTIEWWLSEPKEILDNLNEGYKYKLETVLNDLSSLNLHQSNWYVWSHGSNFDIVLLENAYKALNRYAWWNYKNVRDTRTLFDLVNYDYKAKGGHDALEDAVNQAKAVQEAYKQLKKGI